MHVKHNISFISTSSNINTKTMQKEKKIISFKFQGIYLFLHYTFKASLHLLKLVFMLAILLVLTKTKTISFLQLFTFIPNA